MRSESPTSSRWIPPVAALVLLSLWAWQRLELFRPYLDVTLDDGSVSRQPNALTTVDHPWHGARFSLLLDALRDGHPLRWVGSHQGGFPVEFYPLGAGLIDLVVWAATLGRLPTPLIHTYAVGVVFLLPLIGFMALAAMCRVSLWVGVLAAAAHLCVRGWWWSGGSMELVEWGLITNVAAATFLFLAIPPLVALMQGWSARPAAGAACLLALAILTNPRSAIAVVAIVAAVGLSALWHGDLRLVARRLILPFALAAGLAGPLLFPLIRYRDLYYFVQYTGYDSVRTWLSSSIQAVSGPVAVCCVLGLTFTLRRSAPRAAEVLSLTLAVYSLLTVSLVELPWAQDLVGQLETTRLMPFQRLLMIAVAAIGVGSFVQHYASVWGARLRRDVWLSAVTARLTRPLIARVGRTAPTTRRARFEPSAVIEQAALSMLTAAIVLLYVLAPPAFIPEGDLGLVRIATYADASMVELERGVKLADQRAAPNTALLVLGSYVSWHDQLWAPTWSDRRLFYDDWLWYWQQEHVGDYDVDGEHAYRSDASALDPDFLATHGVGAVVVGRDARRDASTADWLAPLSQGEFYDVYAVADPTTLATIDGANTVILDDEGTTIDVAIGGATGPLVVRTNWFPRWRALIDGKPTEILHRSDGYMEVDVPAGAGAVRLTYAVTRLDWIARLLAVVSTVVVLGLLAASLRPTARSGPR